MSEFLSLLVAGVVTGSIYAISASGLVVTYSTTGVFNFAQGAIGMVMAYVFWQVWQGWQWPTLLAVVFVLLVVAPVFGVIIERAVMRPLYGATTNVSVVVTLGLMLALVGLASTLWPALGNTYTVPQFFTGDQVTIAGINVSYEQLITLALALSAAVGLRILFTRTRVGVAMRAVVDDPELAQLSGASSSRVSGYAWIIGIVFASVAGILTAPQTMNQVQLTELVIYGYAAAVVGRLKSLPLTFVGAMVLGIGYSMTIGYVPSAALTYVTEALPMALLLIALVAMPHARLTVGRIARLRPPKAASIGTAMTGSVLFVAVIIVLSLFVTGNNLNTIAESVATGILALSLIPLSGYAGQISLCQLTFAGLGALAAHWVGGGESVLGYLAAMGLCAGVGALLALPALRLRGLYLALATLGFAVLMDNAFFVNPSVMGISGVVTVHRIHIFGLTFESTRSYVVLLAVVLAACIVGVAALRQSSFGRRIVAMNDSPVAARTVGVNTAVAKLSVFSMSAALAGLAGALFAGIGQSASATQFSFFNSLVLFVAVTLVGATLLSAAVMAGISIQIATLIGAHVPSLSNFSFIFFGLGIVAVGRNPNAMANTFADIRMWVERRRSKTKAQSGSCSSSHVTALVKPETP